MGWTASRITEQWFIILEVLGDINCIKDGNNHHLAITAMQDLIEILSLAELDTLRFNDPEPIPLLGVFLGVLLDACYNKNVDKLKGRLCAVQVICQVFTHQSFRPKDIRILSHFYALYISVMTSSDEPQVVAQLLASCRSVFALELSGSHILIPSTLSQALQLYKRGESHEMALVDCMTIVSSIISIPVHIQETNSFLAWMSGVGISMDELYGQIYNIITLGSSHSNNNVVKHSLCALTLLICTAITSKKSIGI